MFLFKHRVVWCCTVLYGAPANYLKVPYRLNRPYKNPDKTIAEFKSSVHRLWSCHHFNYWSGTHQHPRPLQTWLIKLVDLAFKGHTFREQFQHKTSVLLKTLQNDVFYLLGLRYALPSKNSAKRPLAILFLNFWQKVDICVLRSRAS